MKVEFFRQQWERWVGTERKPRAAAPTASVRDENPLQVDRYTQELGAPHKLSLVSKNPPLRERFGSTHSGGYYLFSLGLPDELFRKGQVEELSGWVRGLNRYLKRPITEFSWNQKDCAHYSLSQHKVTLRPEWHVEPARRTETAKASLTHEMMHGIFHSEGFDRDLEWRSIYHFSLAKKNYEIFDDSNYLGGRSDYFGHPYDNSSEAFASAGSAFYFQAEAFSRFLRNPRTPEDMRLVGKAAWCFMRDRVFEGRVFTPDGIDPFAGEELADLLSEISLREHEALWEAYLSSDGEAIAPAQASLAALFSEERGRPAVEMSEAERLRSLERFEDDLPYLLLDILEEGEGQSRSAALRDLIEDHYISLPEDILDACLTLALREENPALRREAILALGTLKDRSSPDAVNRIAQALLAALDDSDALTRTVAEAALRGRAWGELQAEVDGVLATLPPQAPLLRGLAAVFPAFDAAPASIIR